MQNGHLNETAAQTHLTQVASYFDIVDTAVRTGDTNKRYSNSTNSCTAPSCPISNGSWTSLKISPTGDNMLDLYNSYITAKVKFNVKSDVALGAAPYSGANPPSLFVGYKNAFNSIEQYQLVANGQVIYTQSNAVEEGYVTMLGITESAKRADVFSHVRHADVWDNVDTIQTGAIIGGTLAANTNAEVTMEFKIDLRAILPLSSIKYIPAFIGNLELRVKFGTSGLVYAPLPLEDIMQSGFNIYGKVSYPNISNKFVPIGQPVTAITSVAQDTTSKACTPTTSTVTLTVSDFVVTECNTILWNFGLDQYIYESLIQRYSTQALSFPIQTLVFNPMNATITESQLHATLTATPRFNDMLFILFPRSNSYKTCFENPFFDTLQLKMGGYGSVPDQACSSYGAVFFENSSNALNMNNDLVGFDNDVVKSMTQKSPTSVGWRSNDVTNFIAPFPTSTDQTYQQGQTSNAPITYDFKGQFMSGLTTDTRLSTSCVPIMGFLKDSVFAIQLRPSGPPIVALDEYDISSPQE